MDTNTISAAPRQLCKLKGSRYSLLGGGARCGRGQQWPRYRCSECTHLPDPFEFRFLHYTAMPELFAFGSGVECRFGYAAGGDAACVAANTHRGSATRGPNYKPRHTALRGGLAKRDVMGTNVPTLGRLDTGDGLVSPGLIDWIWWRVIDRNRKPWLSTRAAGELAIGGVS